MTKYLNDEQTNHHLNITKRLTAATGLSEWDDDVLSK